MGVDKLVAALVEVQALTEVTEAGARAIVLAAPCQDLPVDASAWMHAQACAYPKGLVYETPEAHGRLAANMVERCRMVEARGRGASTGSRSGLSPRRRHNLPLAGRTMRFPS